MKRGILFIVAICCCSIVVQGQDSRQGKMKKSKKEKKQEKIPVYNVVIDDPMDAFGNVTSQPPSKPRIVESTLAMPEFYRMTPNKNGDTLYKFEVYDSRNELMNIDTVHDATQIKYISRFKSYTDSTHTYIDAAGKEQPLPVSSIVTRYDRVGDDGWLSVNYASNKYTRLKEFRNEITGAEKTYDVDPKTHILIVTEHKVYRVTPTK